MRVLLLFLSLMLIAGCSNLQPGQSPAPSGQYRHKLSSGLFSIPSSAKAVDWAVLNNSADSQDIRVTVYKFVSGKKEVLPPGPISTTVESLQSFHNANSVPGTFSFGSDYEVVFELNSLLVLPSVEVWSNQGNAVIPGTLIGPAGFIDLNAR